MEDFAPVLIVLVIFTASVIIVGMSLWVAHRGQVLKNRERLAAIEKGIPLPDLAESHRASRLYEEHHCLRRGLLLLFIGAGLALALNVTAGATSAVWGVFVAFIGLGYLACWFLIERPKHGNDNA
jgi:hypothetical protein